MAKIGYIRVSTQEQNTARQELLLESLGVERVYREKISGKDTDRPQLKQMMDYIREGDTVVVESYSRFARNTRDLLELVEQLEKKGVAFVSQKENVNTETAEGRLMFTIFAGLAQFEREQLLQRQGMQFHTRFKPVSRVHPYAAHTYAVRLIRICAETRVEFVRAERFGFIFAKSQCLRRNASANHFFVQHPKPLCLPFNLCARPRHRDHTV